MEKTFSSVIKPDNVLKFRDTFYNDAQNVLAQNACSRISPIDVSTSRNRVKECHHYYTHKIESEGKPVTNQKKSGRCWIFACLNVIKVPFIKQFSLEEFEFSQAYIFFWDKIERTVNIITKYGLMPKKNFPESFSCEASDTLNVILH